MKWHLWLDHPGSQALEHLASASKDIQIKEIKSKNDQIKSIKTVNCDACEIFKVKCWIWWESREFKSELEVQLALDFHEYEEEFDEYNCQLLITDHWSEFMWNYYLTDQKSEIILAALKHLFEILKCQYQLCSQKIKYDNEIYMKCKTVLIWLQSQCVSIESSSSYIKELNEAVKCSERMIKNKAHSMWQKTRLSAAL